MERYSTVMESCSIHILKFRQNKLNYTDISSWLLYCSLYHYPHSRAITFKLRILLICSVNQRTKRMGFNLSYSRPAVAAGN